MDEKVELVLSLLREGYTVNEIQKIYQINNQDFNIILKKIRDLGFNYNKTFNDDGNIIIKVGERLNFNPDTPVRINVKESTFRTVLISDLHIGGPFENPERLIQVSEYAKNHNIHIIFNTGDIINDYYPEEHKNQPITDPVGQAVRYLSYVPYEDKIIYFNLGGNHDYKSVQEKGFDSLRFYEDRRFDQISLGYGAREILLKKDAIYLVHDLRSNGQKADHTIIFRGHSHKYRNKENKVIYVPSLSDNYLGNYEYVPLPSFIDAEFFFYDGLIVRVNLTQIAFVGDDLKMASEDTLLLRPEYGQKLNNQIRRLEKRKQANIT